MRDCRSIPHIVSHQDTAEDRAATIAFSDLLRQFRVAAGLTQEELATRATISVRAVSDLERAERRRPQRETLRLLADALALTDEERATLLSAARTQRSAPPRLLPPSRPSSNLPAPMTPLVGRAEDLAAIDTLLGQATTRLVTITGAGGVGKTRIALSVASDALPSYPDGIFFITLASIRDPALVLATIAQTFGLKERRTEGLRDALIAQFASKRILLVLDNFEQVVVAATDVADLLAACDGLNVLVTSRAALHLRGEHEYRLRPLALPARADVDDSAKVRQSPAFELFRQRATAITHDLRLDPPTTRVIGQICQRLDGLPLALELAAARTRAMQPAELLTRLERRFAVLTEGAHDLPDRQRTMRHVIDWSYDLLPADEQRLFRSLAVFADGCTLDGAEGVGGALRGEPVNLLSGLSSLVDKSLVQADAQSGATRFTLLETVREYGMERLAEGQELVAVQRAHATYFLARATAGTADRSNEARARWMAWVDAEHDNYRAALAWAQAQGEAETGLRLATALRQFWYTRGYLREGRAWLETMLALDGARAIPGSLKAEALGGAARLALRQGDIAAATTLATESLRHSRSTGDASGMAAALNLLGNAAFERNDYQEATVHYREALAHYRQLGDPRGMSAILGNLGRTARFQGDYAGAAHSYEESEVLSRQSGDRQGLASKLGNRGHMARDEGDPARALPLIAESLAIYEQAGERRGIGIALAQLAMIANDTGDPIAARIYIARSMTIRREIDDRWGIAQSLVTLGDIAVATDDPAQAWAYYRDGLAMYQEIGNRLGIVECIERLARQMTDHAQWASAARCFGTAAATREQIGAPILPIDRPTLDRARTRTRTALGDAVWTTTYAAGLTMPPAAILAEIARIAPLITR